MVSGALRADREDRFVRLIARILLAGILPSALYALQQKSAIRFSVFATALTTSMAACGVGAVLGLLFGLPRILAAGSSEDHHGYRANGNLEEVSDWLTKILLGAGISQLGNVGAALTAVVNYISPGIGNSSAAKAFAAGLIVSYVVGGFFLGYLFARLRLGPAFLVADDRSKKLAKPQTLKDLRELEAIIQPDDRRHGLPAADTLTKEQAKRTIEVFDDVAQLKAAGEAFDSTDYQTLARSLLAAGRYEEAAATFIDAAAADPTSPNSLINAGAVLGKYVGRLDDAEKLYLEALSRAPEDPLAWYNLGCNDARRDPPRLDRACENLRRAIDIDNGYRSQAASDACWDAIRSDPAFEALVSSTPPGGNAT